MRILWRSPTVRSAVVYGAAGVGFAGANLILARVLPASEYGLLTLVVALFNLGFALAPGGVDGIVIRHRLDPSPRLLCRVLLPSTLVGGLLASVGILAYDMAAAYGLMILVSVIAGGPLMVAMAQFQSERRYRLSLALNQSPNAMLLLGALVTLAFGLARAWPTLLISTAGWIVCAAFGWAVLFRERHRKQVGAGRFAWSEALPIAGVFGIELLLIQLERLVIPRVLSLHDLATFGVLAAVVGSVFRALQMGVGYSLLPRLRAAEGVAARRALLGREARMVAGLVAVGAIASLAAVPLVERWILQGKYQLSGALLAAAVVSGTAKILDSFGKAMITALAEARDLPLVNLLGIASAGLALVGALAGSRWGLPGVIYGVSMGWLARAASTVALSSRHLQVPVSRAASVT